MLLNPTMRVPFTCSAPKRLEVSTIGSPSVFHTAPPQPMSNARMICSPVFVGGALASQNGLGLLMPANEMERSAMGDPLQRSRARGPRVAYPGSIASAPRARYGALGSSGRRTTLSGPIVTRSPDYLVSTNFEKRSIVGA